MPNSISPEIISNRIAQVQRIVQLPSYDSILAKLVQDAYRNNIQIGFWGEPRSKLRYSINDTRKPYAFWLILKEKPILESRKDVLYDFLHEMGHYWDNEDRPMPGEWQPIKIQRAREERAWAYADEQFNSYPELQADQTEYEAYRQQCLISYPISDDAN
jgi:hypothetical protein